MLADFFYPYELLVIGVAFNIQQILEGAVVSSETCQPSSIPDAILATCFSPAVSSDLIADALRLCAVVLIAMVLIATYVLNKKKTVGAAIFLISLPGLLSVAGLLPAISFAPETIYLGGAGNLGRASGFAVLMLIALLAGWSLVIISYDLFSLKGNFRNYYDHIWYCTIVLTGTFFVFDAGLNKTQEQLKQENATSQKASMYLRRQVEDYFQHCQRAGVQETASCQWASEVQQTLSEYANYNPALFVSVGPEDDLDIYFPYSSTSSQEQSLNIREQIKDYNHVACPVTNIANGVTQLAPVSSICQTPPAAFCPTFPSPPEGFVDKYMAGNTVALASECIVPMLVRSRLIQEKLSQKVKDSADDLRLRWLTFLALSFVAGGKIANATSKIASLDDRDREQRHVLFKLMLNALRLIRRILRWLIAVFLRMVKSLVSMVRAN